MKKCQYCKSHNENNAAVCVRCGSTDFEPIYDKIRYPYPIEPQLPSNLRTKGILMEKSYQKTKPVWQTFLIIILWIVVWPVMYTILTFQKKKWYLWALLPVVWFIGSAYFAAWFN